MYQNVFQTLAIETKLLSRQALQNEKWLEIGCFFIQNYVEQLSKAEKITIGHIKGLIELDEGNFIKFSSVAADRPVNAEILNSQGNSQEGRLTFNAIVANISKETNLTCFHMALERTCSVYGLMTDYKETIHDAGESAESEEQPCPVCHGHHHQHDETCGHHH
jgi:hypothetical protein